MAQSNLIVLTVCLFAALDVASCYCTCGPPKGEICEIYSDHLKCLRNIDNTCPEWEKSDAELSIKATKAIMAALECSGVSGLFSSLGLVMALGGIACLLNNKL